jgi:two-component sensor histidine kinase
VAPEFALAAIQIGIETAILCALIINEGTANVFKYAFPNDPHYQLIFPFERGRLSISLS